MTSRWLWAVVGIGALWLGAGCRYGSASAEGTMGSREVDIGGTVIAWWDTTYYDHDDGEYNKQTRESDDEELHLRLYGHRFDPYADQRFWPWDKQAEFAFQVAMHDWLFFTIEQSGGLSGSARMEFTSENGNDFVEGPRIQWPGPSYGFAPREVTRDDAYPDRIQDYGTKQRFVVEIKTVSREVGQVIEGSYEAQFERDENDAQNAITGSITGDFEAVVLPERLAECNFDHSGAGSVSPCEYYDGSDEP